MALGGDRILGALPEAQPVAAGKAIERADLASEALLLMEDGHCLRSHALESCRLAGPDRNEVFQGTSLRTLLQMTASGIGITLVPEMAVPAEITGTPRPLARPLQGEPSPPIALPWPRPPPPTARFRPPRPCFQPPPPA